MFTRLTLLASTTVFITFGCDEERCRYTSQCRDGELKTCTEGWENGGERVANYETPGCDAANPICIDLDDDHAQCVAAVSPKCGPDFAETCDVALATRCVFGYPVAQDCAVHGNTCALVDGEARCARAPVTACDPQTYPESCAGGGVGLICDAGVVARLDCAVEVPDAACRLTSAERDRTVYCD